MRETQQPATVNQNVDKKFHWEKFSKDTQKILYTTCTEIYASGIVETMRA